VEPGRKQKDEKAAGAAALPDGPSGSDDLAAEPPTEDAQPPEEGCKTASSDDRSGAYLVRLRRHTEELAKAYSQRDTYEGRLNETEATLNDVRAQLSNKSEVLDWIQGSRPWQLLRSIWRLERFAYRLRRKLLHNGVLQGKIDPIYESLDPVAPKLNISGWVFSTVAPVTRVEAFLNDQFMGALDHALERFDPKEFLPANFPGRCGFVGTLRLQGAIPEPRILTIRAFDAKGNKELFSTTLSEIGTSAPDFDSSSLGGADIEPFALNTSPEPVLSIVMPVFNHWVFTLNCLRSIKDVLRDSSLKAEVIVVDDCSTDDTQEMLARVTGVRVISNEQNCGFIDSCNRGAAAATGDYLLFLNNDTLVKSGCFEELLGTFQLKPDAGLVGAKLLYPDGRLQEAGGIIWQDASAWNYGRLDNPGKPEYCYLREVDYCSGACIAVPSHLFQQLGGFDRHYLPAYCEDSDLAFRVRQAGFKVYYQPLAQLVHFEGTTSGTDTSRSIKRYQVVNQRKFFERWSRVLASHGQNGANPYVEKERRVRKRILVLDASPLTPDQDAGSLTVFNHIKIFQSLGYKVTFAPDNLYRDEKYTADLQRIGVECLYWPQIATIKSHLEAFGSYYDLVFMARVEVAAKHIDDARTYCRRAKIIFDTEDLHFVREQRRAQLENDPVLAAAALLRKAEELAVAAKADCTIVVSSFERDVLLDENPELKVSVVPIPRDMPGRQQDFAQRKDLLFIGGFQHPPNVDAVLYFVHNVFPLIKAQLPELKFYVVGSKPPAEIRQLAADASIIVTDYVPDAGPYFNQCRVSVAPLRYGAGLKGKVITSLSYGLPLVASAIACEGIGLEDGANVLIADEPSEFAAKVVRLHTDATLWNELSEAGFKKVSREYSEAAARSFFELLFARLNQPVKSAVAEPTQAGAGKRGGAAGIKAVHSRAT
jgi:GT2 family glycosyltransferase